VTSYANKGRDWELCLDSWHDRYRLEGRALIHRTPPPVRVLSRVDKGVFRGSFLGLGPPDYAGVVAGFGPPRSTSRAVAFDAKDCAGARWSFGDLAEHQARDLEEWSQVGGYAFLALRLAGQGWVVPWSWLGPRWWAWAARRGRAAEGTASVVAADFAGQTPRPMGRLGDWLSALEGP
jgi:penicillin-binding protein-related factor A (putative recombinase)